MGWARYAHSMRIFVFNSGLFFIRPTPAALELLEKVIYRVETENGWDQALFNEVIFFPNHPGTSSSNGSSSSSSSSSRGIVSGSMQKKNAFFSPSPNRPLLTPRRVQGACETVVGAGCSRERAHLPPLWGQSWLGVGVVHLALARRPPLTPYLQPAVHAGPGRDPAGAGLHAVYEQ